MRFDHMRSGSLSFCPMAGVVFGRRFRALSGCLDIFDRYRRKIITSNLHVDDRKGLALVGGVQGFAQFSDGICLETGATPITRQLRVGPWRDFEQIAAVGDRAENGPSTVINRG